MGRLADILGDEEALVGFSDYRESGVYRTSTLYLIALRDWDRLAHQLQAVRQRHNVESRALQYKNRKQWRRLWAEAIDAWLHVFRDTPGLAVCVAFSGKFRASHSYREFLNETNRSLREGGSNITGRVLADAAQKLAPLLVVAPLLQRGVLTWYSDIDSLLCGDIGQHSIDLALAYLHLGGSDVTLLYPDYMRGGRLPENVELGLSVPDLVCGVLADWLPSPFRSRTIDSAQDPAAVQILAGLAQMGSLSDNSGPRGKLHISIIDRTDTGWRHDSLKLSANCK